MHKMNVNNIHVELRECAFSYRLTHTFNQISAAIDKSSKAIAHLCCLNSICELL